MTSSVVYAKMGGKKVELAEKYKSIYFSSMSDRSLCIVCILNGELNRISSQIKITRLKERSFGFKILV